MKYITEKKRYLRIVRSR